MALFIASVQVMPNVLPIYGIQGQFGVGNIQFHAMPIPFLLNKMCTPKLCLISLIGKQCSTESRAFPIKAPIEHTLFLPSPVELISSADRKS